MNSLSRNLIRLIIEELGHKVLEAKSGDAALEAFEIASPDIVLLDINIGDPDGFEVCKNIRKKYPDLGVTIVFLTGMSSEEHVIKSTRRRAEMTTSKNLLAPTNSPLV